jgi:hypothetical protein
VARRLLSEAANGNMAAIGMLADRTDGRVPQGQIIMGDADQPVRYCEVPRKAASTSEWLQSIPDTLAQAQLGSDKVN